MAVSHWLGPSTEGQLMIFSKNKYRTFPWTFPDVSSSPSLILPFPNFPVRDHATDNCTASPTKRPTFVLLWRWHAWTVFWTFLAETLLGVSIQKVLYFTDISSSTILCKTGNPDIVPFHLNAACSFARPQPVAAWFLQPCLLITHIHAALWLPKLNRKEVVSFTLQLLDCVTCVSMP